MNQPPDSTGTRRPLDTRQLIIETAERLYAERGVSHVSNRQVAEAIGSSNNSVVAYHIGTKEDLITAVARSHSEAVVRTTTTMVRERAGSSEPRDHIECLVLPYLEHLASLGNPSWCARFTAQMLVAPEPSHRLLFDSDLLPLHAMAFDALERSVPSTDPTAARLRRQMARQLVVHTCAEQERDAAATKAAADWPFVAEGLVEAVRSILTNVKHRLPSVVSRPL